MPSLNIRAMSELVVTGGNPLMGTVAVLGAKNAVLKQQVAALLAPGKHMLENVPDIIDVQLMGDVLAHVGATCRFEDHTLIIDVPDDLVPEAPLGLVRRMRASILVLGPLLARCNQVRVALPGGDDLGARPIDMHIDGLRKMGAEFELRHGVLEGSAPAGLRGAEIDFDFPSVGATENVLLAAVLARGETIINNAAREPELEDLARYLNEMGARITGAGTSTMRILGVEALVPATHKVIPDRLEAGTFAIAAAITAGSVRVEGCRPEHLRMELRKLTDAGCRVETGDDWIELLGPKRPTAVDFATLPFPGFHTDLHPPMVALLAVAEGTSVITENVYESRFRYVGELARMGADITTEWQHAVIRGVPFLSGCPVEAPDIRAGAALVLAALRAEGYSRVSESHHIDRGYERFAERLRLLGAEIETHAEG
jgi:UDP-N-acetylglucosamine 1-carboxyvinyltransferase